MVYFYVILVNACVIPSTQETQSALQELVNLSSQLHCTMAKYYHFYFTDEETEGQNKDKALGHTSKA